VSRTDRQELKTVFDEFIEVADIHNDSEVDRVVAGIVSQRKIKAIYGSYESAIEIAGRLRSKFNIPGMTEEETLKVRNKALMKTVMKQNGIATADFTIVNTLSDRLRLLAKLDKPMVVKPINGAATKHTYKIDGFQDLFKATTLKALFRHKTILAESFIDGEEYHCDSIVVNGKIIFSSVSKYFCNCLNALNSESPWGSICYPASYDSDDVISSIKNLNERAVKALNIQNSVCHLEAFVDKQSNVTFGEIAARIGGSPMIPEAVKNTYGVDLHKAFVDLEMHNYNHHYDPKPILTGWTSFPSRRGTVTKISSEADYANVEGLVKVKILNKIGDRLNIRKNTSIRTGYIVMEDTDYEQLIKKLADACSRFQLEVK
ncbi:MAG: ATP-grasp domain-containing protein, partial [Acidaminococcaceae bacterium]